VRALATETGAGVPVLVHGLGDARTSIREGCVDALVRMGRPAFEGLKQGLRHENPAVRSGTAQVIFRLGRSVTSDLRTALVNAARAEKDPAVAKEMHRALP